MIEAEVGKQRPVAGVRFAVGCSNDGLSCWVLPSADGGGFSQTLKSKCASEHGSREFPSARAVGFGALSISRGSRFFSLTPRDSGTIYSCRAQAMESIGPFSSRPYFWFARWSIFSHLPT